MKKFDGKSFVAGVIVGTLGISTAFAATGIRSAVLSNTGITLRGASLSLERPLVSVVMEGEQTAGLYVPADEVFEKLGYGVSYDGEKNILDFRSRRLWRGLMKTLSWSAIWDTGASMWCGRPGAWRRGS